MKRKRLSATLNENHLFSKAYTRGVTDANKYTAVYILRNIRRAPNGSPLPTRMGITVNRKLGNAVRRNRVKRIIREAYRNLRPRLQDGFLVVIAARGAAFHQTVKAGDIEIFLKRSFFNLGAFDGQTLASRRNRGK